MDDSTELTKTSIAAVDLCSLPEESNSESVCNADAGSTNIKKASDYWDDILRICEDVEQLMYRKHSGSVSDLNAARLFSTDTLIKTKSEPDMLSKLEQADELQHLRNTVIELRKLCSVIIGQLQNSHQSVAQLRNNLTQKELLSVSLSKQLLELKANYCLQRLQSLQQIQSETRQSIEPSSQQDLKPMELPTETVEPSKEKEACPCESNKFMMKELICENERLQKKLCCVLRSLQQLSAELRESHANYDHLEIAFNWMRSEMKSLLKMRSDECDLMRERVNYLTSKLLTVDRAYRTAAGKLAKLEKQDKLDKRKTT